MRTRVADAKERKRLWPEVVKAYSGYESYQRHTEREIPARDPRATLGGRGCARKALGISVRS